MTSATISADPASPSRALAILGMHRSGTSALAGTLRACGVYFGDVLDQGIKHNPKGLQEAPSVLFMQEDLLNKSGGAWHDPPAQIEWQPLHKSVRDLFIESRVGRPYWAFKDPRTLLTLEGWIDVLPDLECVGIFRHPAEVAMSIHVRNGFPLEKCAEIWRAYNSRLLHFHHTRGIPIIEFVGDQATMEASLRSVIERLGLIVPSASEGFYDARMKHQDRPEVPLTDDIRDLYQDLRSSTI
ncbi:MAG: sulfotransferase family protein [Pseudomonadota bacterium]